MRKIIIFLSLGLLTSCSLVTLFQPAQVNKDAELVGVFFINEILASHPTETDWIEFYNNSDQSLDLSGFGLSDDILEPMKWTFPKHYLVPPKSFFVITLDGQNNNPGFGIAAVNDQIVVSSSDGITIIDKVDSVPLSYSASYGRTEDGGDSWTTFAVPTKGGPNQ